MSLDPAALPRRWFAAAAIATLLAGAAATWFLLRPPAPTPGGQVGAVPSHLLHVRQYGEDGAVIPWGGSTPGTSVRIDLGALSKEAFEGAEFRLSSGDEAPRLLWRDSFEAQFTNLAPGRYRWSVALRRRGDATPILLEPPRGNPTAADFIVLPVPTIERLVQVQLNGDPLAADRRSEGGVRLKAELKEAYPDGILEVEVKPAAREFDGQDVLRAPIQDIIAQVQFSGDGGPYRWRARITLPGRAAGAWQAAGTGQGPDFVLFNPPPPTQDTSSPKVTDNTGPPRRKGTGDPKPPPPTEPGAQKPSATSSTGAGASGLPGGSRDPLPSHQKPHQVPQSSIWQVAFMRLLIGVGVVAGVAGGIVLALRGMRRFARRS